MQEIEMITANAMILRNSIFFPGLSNPQCIVLLPVALVLFIAPTHEYGSGNDQYTYPYRFHASIIDDNYSTDVLYHLCVNVDVICMIT